MGFFTRVGKVKVYSTKKGLKVSVAKKKGEIRRYTFCCFWGDISPERSLSMEMEHVQEELSHTTDTVNTAASEASLTFRHLVDIALVFGCIPTLLLNIVF